MRVDPNSPVPVFRQIVEEVRRAVAAGIYRPGELIPSVRAMALALLVNPNTVQRAYEELEREGLISSKKGTGMIVSDDSKSTARQGVEQHVSETLSSAIAAGQSAGLSRAAIDRLYRNAW